MNVEDIFGLIHKTHACCDNITTLITVKWSVLKRMRYILSLLVDETFQKGSCFIQAFPSMYIYMYLLFIIIIIGSEQLILHS